VTAEGWAAAPPVAKQAVVGSSLDVIAEYVRASAAAGGFDRPQAQLRRTLVTLDERGVAQLSKACEKLLEQAEKIEASAAERISKHPHADTIVKAALSVMLFEAVPLSGADDRDRRKPRAAAARASRI
jgi:hypothetical protein